MADISLLQVGIQGVNTGLQDAQQAAQNIANLGRETSSENAGPVGDFAESAVELIQAENQVKASAQIIKTADETLGTIIDTIA